VNLSRRKKRLIQVCTDVVLIWLALWLSFIVRLGVDEMYNPILEHTWLCLTAPVVAIPLSALILAVVVYWYSSHKVVVPRSIIFNYWWLSIVIIGGLRLIMRQYFLGDWFSGAQQIRFTSRGDGQVKVAIYGAGTAGNQLLAALCMGSTMRPAPAVLRDLHVQRQIGPADHQQTGFLDCHADGRQLDGLAIHKARVQAVSVGKAGGNNMAFIRAKGEPPCLARNGLGATGTVPPLAQRRCSSRISSR